MKQYSDGNRRISEEYYDSKSLFSEEYNEGSIWRPNRFRITWYRVVFAIKSIFPKLLLMTKNAFRGTRGFIKGLRLKRDAY